MGLIRFTFYSQVLREETYISIVMPTYKKRGSLPDYTGKTIETEEDWYKNRGLLKTLYVLHGGSDDCTFYYRNTGIERYGQENGFAVVMPEVKNSFYCNQVYGKDYFTYLSEELPDIVQGVFPLSPKRADHFVVGNSMGSHGAIKWALNCPEFFSAAAGMSGVADVEDGGFFNDSIGMEGSPVHTSFGTLSQYRGSKNDLRWLAKTAVKRMKAGEYIPRLYSCCGTEDPYFEGTKCYKEYADSIGLPLVFETSHGSHQWEYWDKSLRRIIQWMGLTE